MGNGFPMDGGPALLMKGAHTPSMGTVLTMDGERVLQGILTTAPRREHGHGMHGARPLHARVGAAPRSGTAAPWIGNRHSNQPGSPAPWTVRSFPVRRDRLHRGYGLPAPSAGIALPIHRPRPMQPSIAGPPSDPTGRTLPPSRPPLPTPTHRSYFVRPSAPRGPRRAAAREELSATSPREVARLRRAGEARGEATRRCAAPHTNVTPAVVGHSPTRDRRNHRARFSLRESCPVI